MHSCGARAQPPLACAGNLKAVYQYAQRIADGFRQPLPESWPAPLRALISDCWAQRSSERPTFAQVLDRLHAIQVSAWQPPERSHSAHRGWRGAAPPRWVPSTSCCLITHPSPGAWRRVEVAPPYFDMVGMSAGTLDGLSDTVSCWTGCMPSRWGDPHACLPVSLLAPSRPD